MAPGSVTSHTSGAAANPESATSNRPARPPGVGKRTNCRGPASAGRSATASTQSSHESAPLLPPVERKATASVLWPDRSAEASASLIRLPLLLEARNTACGRIVAIVCPPRDIVIVTPGLARAPTRVR